MPSVACPKERKPAPRPPLPGAHLVLALDLHRARHLLRGGEALEHALEVRQYVLGGGGSGLGSGLLRVCGKRTSQGGG